MPSGALGLSIEEQARAAIAEGASALGLRCAGCVADSVSAVAFSAAAASFQRWTEVVPHWSAGSQHLIVVRMTAGGGTFCVCDVCDWAGWMSALAVQTVLPERRRVVAPAIAAISLGRRWPLSKRIAPMFCACLPHTLWMLDCAEEWSELQSGWRCGSYELYDLG